MFQKLKDWADNQLFALKLQKNKMSKLSRYLVIAGLSIWCILFIGGLIQFTGSRLIYAIFSLAFFLLLINGFSQQDSYGYLFLTVFLWLGFWLKLTLHLILGYAYIEPIGAFTGTSAAWNEVLLVSTLAAFGILIGRIIYRFCFRKNLGSMVQHSLAKVPNWYPSNRKWLWALIIIAIVSVVVFNNIYGIYQAGLTPKTILVWPLNAVVSYILYIGLTMSVSTFLWWDISLKKYIFWPIQTIFIESFLVSVSSLSRAIYIFHTIPQMLALYKNKKSLIGITAVKEFLIIVVFVGFFITSQSAVNTFRKYFYNDNVSLPNESQISSQSHVYQQFQIAKVNIKNTLTSGAHKDMYQNILQLTTDRWIGLEGVMAVQSYYGKGLALFLSGIREEGTLTKESLYQKICSCSYSKATNTFQFGSAPGFIAVLYYSGSPWAVMSWAIILSLLLLLVERSVKMLVINPLLCSLIGVDIANAISQFGGTPQSNLKHLILVFIGVLFIWFIQLDVVSSKRKKYIES